ncbi:KAP family P-loop NTPase fold protein [Paenibacillus periandrae]|uniref:KAP family P-loop NTPase fold protein n=1 Tax=Paenibacillus periandrae TaxID=1761741 RepID=UPI001F08CAB8|nr:P-loop NTPase fold protein [Paenibacillus periandrae]
MTNNKMPSILDREIQDPENDAFGHRHYAIALQNLVENNTPPYSIGLLGNWGVGKSTIKEMYLSTLKDDSIRSKEVLPITFNSWRYGGQNVKRALLRHVYLEIGGNESELKDRMYHQISEVLQKPRKWSEIWQDIYQRYLFYPVQLLMIFLIILLMFILFTWGIGGNVEKSALAGIFAVVFAAVVRFVFSSTGMLMPRLTTETKVYPPSVNAEQYSDYLVDQLHTFKDTSVGRKTSKIVVFVDDLDRLSAEEMVEGLDAVRIFMEIPKDELPKDLGIVFVLSCDEEKIAYALSNKRNGQYLPGSVSNKQDARRFLDRIFQFRLEVLPFPKRDLRTYATNKLLEVMPQLQQELEQKGIHLSNVIDRLIHPNVQSPRNALQLLNSFIQSWWIAKKREFEGANSNVSGGLGEGMVTDHPETLAIICALRVDFHYFYEDLLQDHNLLTAFSKMFISKQEGEVEISERSKRILSQYTTKSESDSSTEHLLKDEYHDLKQYLKYIQGIRLPNYLQPLLLLTQDPLSRKIGNNRAIYDALINGDSISVLEELGANSDDKSLSVDTMNVFNDIIEDLQNETEVYILNASFTLGQLVHRFPSNNFHSSISFIINSLLKYPNFRWRLGIDDIKKTFLLASVEEKSILGTMLIQEFIREETSIDFKLTTGQTPLIDELKIICNKVILILLEAKYSNKINFKNEGEFYSWLKIRRFSNGKKEDHFSYEELEKWIEKYPELLNQLGMGYINEGVDLLKSNKDINENSFLNSMRQVIKAEWPQGEESKNKVWEFLINALTVRSISINAEALKFSNENVTIMISEQQYNHIILSLTTRLVLFEESPVSWSLQDKELYSTSLINLISMSYNLNSDSFESLVKIINLWMVNIDTVELSIRLSELIRIQHKSTFNQLYSSWVGKLFNEAQPQLIKYLGEQYFEVTEDNKQKLVEQFTPLYTSQTVDVTQVNVLSLFLSGVNEQSVKEENLSNLLSTLFGRIYSWNSYTDYITTILSASAQVIRLGFYNNVGQALYTIFTQTAINDPAVYNKLCNIMLKSLPKSHAALLPYDPEVIFEHAASVYERYYQSYEVLNILNMLNNMVKENVVSIGQGKRVLNLAVLSWKNYKYDVKEMIIENKHIPSDDQVYQLFALTDFNDNDEINVLVNIINQVSSHLDDSMFTVIALKIVRELDSTDAIRIWVEANRQKIEELINLINQEMNNAQIIKMTSQLLVSNHHNIDITKKLISASVDIINQNPELDGALKLVLRDKENINRLFGEDQISKLHEVLLTNLIKSNKVSYKREFSNWLLETKAGVFLKGVKRFNPTNDDLQILQDNFKNNSTIKKLLSA